MGRRTRPICGNTCKITSFLNEPFLVKLQNSWIKPTEDGLWKRNNWHYYFSLKSYCQSRRFSFCYLRTKITLQDQQMLIQYVQMSTVMKKRPFLFWNTGYKQKMIPLTNTYTPLKLFPHALFEIFDRTSQKYVVWCKGRLHSACQSFKTCSENGLKGCKWVRDEGRGSYLFLHPIDLVKEKKNLKLLNWWEAKKIWQAASL